MSAVAVQLASVRARIARACERAGRDPASVRLVAVSKFHPAAALCEAYAAGQRDFGENYAQELVDKARALADLPDLQLRFIGGLQRNKVKLLVETGCVIETLANAATARALSDRAAQQHKQVEVMLQVNLSNEPQKSGISPAELPELVQAVRALPALTLSGLMTIPKADDPAEAARAYRTLAEHAQVHGLQELSMGMSDDLELAIAAGATSVRVGTAIFGPRPAR